MTFQRRRKEGGRNVSALQLVVWLAILGAAALATHLMGPGSESPAGSARVIDGDSLVVGGREVRLVGIDAPEGRQTCTRDGKEWRCGEAARTALVRLIGGQKVACRSAKADQHDRALSVCEAGGRDLNAAMVEEGFAVSFGSDYRREEASAREARRGLWAGEFERPQDWRRRHGIGR